MLLVFYAMFRKRGDKGPKVPKRPKRRKWRMSLRPFGVPELFLCHCPLGRFRPLGPFAYREDLEVVLLFRLPYGEHAGELGVAERV